MLYPPMSKRPHLEAVEKQGRYFKQVSVSGLDLFYYGNKSELVTFRKNSRDQREETRKVSSFVAVSLEQKK